MSTPLPQGMTLVNNANVVRWLLNLLAHPEAQKWLMDDPLRFAALFAVLRPLVQLPESLEKLLPSDEAQGGLRMRSKELEEWQKSDHMPMRGRVSPRYVEAFWEGTKMVEAARRHPQVWEEALRQWVQASGETIEGFDQQLSAHAKALAEAPSLLESPLPSMGREPEVLFRLNLLLFSQASATMFQPKEIQTMELSFALAENESLRLFFEVLASNPRAYNAMMAVMMDMEQDDWEALVAPKSRLAAMHLVPFDSGSRRVLPMAPFWHGWFGTIHRSAKEALEKFLVPLKRERNAGALARLAPADTDMVRRILLESLHRQGTNVLLYGARSIDKLGWVHDLATACDRVPYTLPDNLPEQVRPSVCYLAQRLLQQINPKGWLVLPQADTILTRTHRGRHQFLFMELEFDSENSDSAGEADLLVENPVPSIWLVNGPDRLSENNIGRFLYTCELKAASRAERRQEIQDTLRFLELSEEFITELSQHLRVGEQQLNSAAELVWRFAPKPFDSSPEGVAAREALVRQAIEQSQKALNRRQKENLRQPVTQYSLELLNVHGAFTVPQILKSLRHNPNASLCFYGLPGTGKTQLAEHLAVELDKPLLIKRASDILGKYVGENEKNIKAMFDEASDEDAVLLLDEADSFLRDRNLARQSWEVSTVNELLQGMERHRGVFICTTNLFNCLDLASLRRFTFKLEFLELSEEQRWRMFLNEAGVEESAFSEEQAEAMKLDLYGIRGLAPGDFATIQRQIRLMGETLSPKGWIKALQAEAKAKMREATMTLGATQTN